MKPPLHRSYTTPIRLDEISNTFSPYIIPYLPSDGCKTLDIVEWDRSLILVIGHSEQSFTIRRLREFLVKGNVTVLDVEVSKFNRKEILDAVLEEKTAELIEDRLEKQKVLQQRKAQESATHCYRCGDALSGGSKFYIRVESVNPVSGTFRYICTHCASLFNRVSIETFKVV